jgi:Zn-dependent protease with chaperone function
MRNFFEQQDHARRLTFRFATILALATVGTILVTGIALAALVTLLSIAHVRATTNIQLDQQYLLNEFLSRCWLGVGVSCTIVLGTALFKTFQLLDGGGWALARQLGGQQVLRDAPDPQHRQLVNIVEELTVASGVPAPKVFVLPDEPGINAFAAGMRPKDMVVGVTQGALDMLDRSQLQGVLAHEFSHILNRDVQLNLKTLGILDGIEAIASVARYLGRMSRSSTTQAAPLAAVFAAVLWPIGKIGWLFGLLAKMALNRQREFLADAAAVQFTRNPEALADVLKLIAAHERGAEVESNAAQLASHLFFAQGTCGFANLLRSHPTLEERIVRLQPDWDGQLDVPATLRVS